MIDVRSARIGLTALALLSLGTLGDVARVRAQQSGGTVGGIVKTPHSILGGNFWGLPNSGRDTTVVLPRGSVEIRPDFIPPDYGVPASNPAYGAPVYAPRRVSPIEGLRIPRKAIGFYNATTAALAFEVEIDGQRQQVKLEPREIITAACGECKATSKASIDTGRSKTSEVSLADGELYVLTVNADGWQIVKKVPAALTWVPPQPPGQ